MMKANNQLGFININEDSIDKIIKDDEVIFERGFLRERTTTTLPITFGGVGKDLKDYRVYGNTYQNSTTGKNLRYIKDETAAGVSLTYDNKSGKISIKGTATRTDGIKLSDGGEVNIPAGTYTLSVSEPLPVLINSVVSLSSSTNVAFRIPAGNTSVTINVPSNGVLAGLYFAVTNGTTYNFDFYLQLEEGSVATEFEPYTGGQPSPNPDYPQEIISCGDRTKNLLNVSNEYSVTTWQEIDVNLQPGDYIVNCTNTSTNVKSGNASLMNFYHSDNTYDQLYFNRVDKVGTVTITAETTKVRIYSGSSYTVSNGKTTILTNLMIRKSNISDGTYEPYGKYKIPVNVRSDNLCNGNLTQGQYRNGVFENDINRFTTDFLEVTPSTQYTFSLNSNDNLASLINLAYFDENKNFLGTRSTMGLDTFSNTDREKTITTTNTTYYLRWTLRPYGSKSSISYEEAVTQKLQFEKGNKTSYKPYYNATTNIYLDEPLRRIEDYFDYIDFINGKVVRKIKEDILNGNENWTAYGSNLYTVQKIYNNNPFIVGYGLSNLYIYNSIQSGINAGTVNGEFALQKSGQHYSLFIKNTDIGNLENLKSSLSIKNMILQYPLETPTEEPITLPNIPTIDGNNILNIETEITPSQVYIKYKSNN